MSAWPSTGKVLAILLAAIRISVAWAADEDNLKIGYLYNFTKFVEWPVASAENQTGSPLTICVLGDEILTTVAATLRGKMARQRPIHVLNAKRGNDFKDCQVAFVSASESWRVNTILNDLKHQPVLTVSDANNFSAQGGMIGLVRHGDRLRFEINLDAVKKAGLKIGSQVLQLAVKIVE